ncbi:hypothetical protein AVEN_176462-1 [Araneus ventricosus]|uniref:Uncharacterized protein n=1 Tax=Araneus ventricosus TaxID=182803 RepID=A0A4Y2JK83_ARAVE|nr:hypothetical protein AVEN_176462-1 [Araneus ventricosus]
MLGMVSSNQNCGFVSNFGSNRKKGGRLKCTLSFLHFTTKHQTSSYYSYEPGISLACNISLMVGKRHLQKFYRMPEGDLPTPLATIWRQNEGARKCENYGPIYTKNRDIAIRLENSM